MILVGAFLFPRGLGEVLYNIAFFRLVIGGRTAVHAVN